MHQQTARHPILDGDMTHPVSGPSATGAPALLIAGPDDALSQLAAVLEPRDFITVLTTSQDRPPRLTVTTRHAGLTADIYADQDCYWWGWAERIAPASDPHTAAATITRTLLPTGTSDA
jgi:hypothetical protein